jgi:small-conductance mechanosensitive channel
LPGRVEALMGTWVAIPIIVATGWAVMRAVRAVIDVQMVDVDVEEEMRARAVRTHLVILRRLASISIGFVTIAVALMRFELVRDLGVSLLASAGVAGVALGFAAQKSLGAVVAGLQLSIAQPVRLGDAIVWQGQWGTVEEITLTWVRLKLNDERRLIVPVDKFLTEAFENWSMPGTELIGLIEFPVDPTVPVDDLRAELHRLAEGHSAHDGRECLLQVIDLNERAAMVRARVSTSDVSRAFAMRCELREALMEYLRTRDEGRYLARQRWQDVEAAAQAA